MFYHKSFSKEDIHSAHIDHKKSFFLPLADPLMDIVFQPTAQAGTACTKTNQWWVDWLEGIEKK